MARNASELYDEMFDDTVGAFTRCVDDPQSPLQSRTDEAPFCQNYILEDINENVPNFRTINERWAIANVLHFFAETEDAEMLINFNPQARRFVVDGKWRGAYGSIAMPQIARCIELLNKYPSSRRAVVSMGALDHNDINRPACWSFLHFLEQDEELQLGVYQRSLNLFRIMPYDCILLTNILNYVAAMTDSANGALYWTIGSLHLCEEDKENGVTVQNSRIILPPNLLADRHLCYNALKDPEKFSNLWEV